jgi:hypothetical protein
LLPAKTTFQAWGCDLSSQSKIVLASFLAVLLLVFGQFCSGVPAVSGLNSKAQVPQELAVDAVARTVVDMTFEELLQDYPRELADLEFNANQDELDFILRKVGEKVEAFFRDFSNTASKEQVRLERLGFDGRVEASTQKNYSYLILVHPDKAGIQFQEDSTDSKGHQVDPKRMSRYYVINSGYAGLCLFLHRSHHFGSRFRYLGRQTSESCAHVIAFAQKPEVRDFLASIIDKQWGSRPLLFQGIVWVDPHTNQIVRMRTDLLAPDMQVGLARQSTDIRFSEVHFDAVPQSFWLPREVTVTWRWAGITFRNRHRYSDYKLFTIESYDKVGQPQIKK